MKSNKEEKNIDAEEVEMTFEEAMEKLELLVEQLECGRMSLDESLDTFEQGMKLASRCRKRLDNAERRIEQLINEGGKIKSEPFNSKEDKE
ncbi:exodeoxyribonuclease VII, small subunit [Methanosalsum zhilinae DSM 4017]|uniref:Exodeoxyribonuclease VII, small subunit n=1 Tax=Methanosalsum zhilinae (strain DSM 4017 / NBRC 107636 / OCM 62 / WeN5) TaxID=679901 RepID=F7XQN7_METZD|nr:exodeoxyribonuclease VII small subunit [Methanosalsum zhilinae]AEH61636.1 exodeoxyribonuclease VII, small subunit [Methanosalsum zhilinae DSM 4017]